MLVAIGAHERMSRILLCSGGKHFIDDAVRLTATLAAALRAEVTLFHIMAEPPAIYAHLIELEEDVDALLASGSELGRNLAAEKKALEKLGVAVKMRIRHGFIIDQLLEEMREGNYDLIVSGSSRARGPLRALYHGRCDPTHSQVRPSVRYCCPLSTARDRPKVCGNQWRASFAENVVAAIAASRLGGRQQMTPQNPLERRSLRARGVAELARERLSRGPRPDYRSLIEISPRINPSPTSRASTGNAAIRLQIRCRSDSALAHNRDSIRNFRKQFFRSGKIDLQRRQITIVDSDDFRAGSNRHADLLARMHLDQHAQFICGRTIVAARAVVPPPMLRQLTGSHRRRLQPIQ